MFHLVVPGPRGRPVIWLNQVRKGSSLRLRLGASLEKGLTLAMSVSSDLTVPFPFTLLEMTEMIDVTPKVTKISEGVLRQPPASRPDSGQLSISRSCLAISAGLVHVRSDKKCKWKAKKFGKNILANF